MQPSRSIAALTLAMAFGMLHAADWPQYRGPNSDGTTSEVILTSWPADGLPVVWKSKMGEGFGSVAVVGPRLYVFAERGGDEVVIAMDSATGKEVWAVPLGKTIFEKAGGNGPRSTPTIDGDHVYVLGTYLRLTCLSAKDGKLEWSHDLATEFDGQLKTSGIGNWGNAASPVIEGDLVLVAGGGNGQALMAFNKATGKLAWKSQDDKITHATAVPATIANQKQVVFFTQSGLAGVDAKGEVLWRAQFPFSTSTAASPLIEGNVVYCSAGYGVGGGAFTVSKQGDAWKATPLWRTSNENINHWSTPVVKEGYVYGLFGFKEFKTEPLKCIDIKTGKLQWSESGFGQGGTIIVGGNLLVQGDQGQLVLAKAAPDKYSELARAQVLTGKCWTMPVVANGHIYCRSTKEIVCLDARAK
jgi:outer membrane protein assembly factor BamB